MREGSSRTTKIRLLAFCKRPIPAGNRPGRFFRPSILLMAFLLAVGAVFTAGAQSLRNDYFVHEFWAELEPMAGGPLATGGPNQGAISTPLNPQSGGPVSQAGPNQGAATPGVTQTSSGQQPGSSSAQAVSPQPANQPLTDILKEAQYVYSGMIYGFSFVYTPGDVTRGVSESFALSPIALIKWGDPHLKVLDSRVDKSRLIARVMYSLASYQETWKEGWDSNVYPTATGRGTSRYFLSYDEKIASYEDAMKEAIRDYLRKRIYNKPREVKGQLVLRGSPYTIIDAGQYVTTLTVKLRIDSVQPYEVF